MYILLSRFHSTLYIIMQLLSRSHSNSAAANDGSHNPGNDRGRVLRGGKITAAVGLRPPQAQRSRSGARGHGPGCCQGNSQNTSSECSRHRKAAIGGREHKIKEITCSCFPSLRLCCWRSQVLELRCIPISVARQQSCSDEASTSGRSM